MILAICVLLPLTLAQGGVQKSVYVAKHNVNAVVGKVAWVTTDASGKKVGGGSKELRLKDISIIVQKSAAGKMASKRIVLDGGFSFSFSSLPSLNKKRVLGFALVGELKGEDVSSFDWFNVVSETKAEMLQEPGTLQILTGPTPEGPDVLGTKFLSDVSVRLPRSAHGPGAEPSWRIRILKGSDIRWPILRGKEVVLPVLAPPIRSQA
ncbi:MAG TPA: hypothetical protein VK934_09675 [Fimbriimonas sp.]|nr:hypothetical protein [Fimbriimonas sp.]